VGVEELDQEVKALAEGTHKTDVSSTLPVVRYFGHEIVGGNNNDRVSEKVQKMMSSGGLNTAT
jgi:hypothetical protein